MMKNFIFSALLIFILGNLCSFGLPWWAIAPIAAVVVWLFPQTGLSAFLAGFLGGMLLWGLHAFLLNSANEGVFSAKIGQIFQGLSSNNLLLTTALMGGVLAGLGALTGQWANDLRANTEPKDYYTRRKKGRYK
jgi:hypothetical protein